MSLPRLMTYIDYEIYNCLAKLFSFEGKSCPGGDTPCSGNGQCDPTTGFCNCQEGHQGSDCSGKGPFTNYVYKRRGIGGQKNRLFVNYYTVENVNGGG